MLLLVPAMPLAGTWKKTEVPSYAASVPILAVSGDGVFYSASSNRHGYFFQSVLDAYRFEAEAGTDRAGQLVARRNIVFLADTCDAYTPDTAGVWSRANSSKTFRRRAAGGQVIVLHLLSDSLEPRHAC
ncbi:MAG: hypothetical protein RDA78_14370 [Roseibium sp.]|uniref:hypothetical protein n=1 Tax=Roseibium sp. TaxID=1936156 RepID=UPI003D9C0E4F